jgi:ribosomal protein S4
MKQLNPKNRNSGTEKTTSNNENNKKQTTIVKEENKKLLSHKASARKRAKRHAPETTSFQNFRCILEVYQRQVRDSTAAMDTAERAFEKRAFPKEDYRLFSCGSSRD